MSDFEVFFDLNYEPVVRALALAFAGRNDIEDAAQEGFAAAYLRWSTVGAMARPAAWVYVVASRRLYRSYRLGRRAPTMAGRGYEAAAEDEVLVDRIGVETLLQELSPRQRATVVLRFLADLGVEEVAEALGCAPGTVKAATHAALGRLRAQVRQEEVKDG